MSKKAEKTEAAEAANPTQEDLHRLYAAYQVHTLAQMLYERLASTAYAQGAWPAPGYVYATQPTHAMPAQRFQPTAQPVSPRTVYWYP